VEEFTDQLPPRLRKKAQQLGRQISLHKLRAYKRPLYILIASACFFISFLMLCGGLSLISQQLGGALIGIAFALGAGAAGYFVLRSVSKNQGLQVVVCRNGLLHLSSDEATVISWDEVDAVYQNITQTHYEGVGSEITHVYTVVTDDNTSIALSDNLQNIEALGETIQQEVARVKLPDMIEAFDRGKPVKFGCLSISKQGLTQNKDFIAWEDVKGVKVQTGYFVISKKGK
jgi:hypothetical protein